MNELSYPGIKIEPFIKEHGAKVLELIVGIQQNEFGIPISASDQPDLLDIPNFYQTGGGNFWVTTCNQQIAGTIALLDIGDGQGALRKMFVDAFFRGADKGVAKRLLNTLVTWSEHHGINEIFLGTTSKFLAAHRFYEKNGFTEILEKDLPDQFPVMKVDTKFYRIAV